MTKHGDQLKCDTDGCNATAPLATMAAQKTIWYFDYKQGKFLDYCPKHHPTIRRNEPGNA